MNAPRFIGVLTHEAPASYLEATKQHNLRGEQMATETESRIERALVECEEENANLLRDKVNLSVLIENALEDIESYFEKDQRFSGGGLIALKTVYWKLGGTKTL